MFVRPIRSAISLVLVLNLFISVAILTASAQTQAPSTNQPQANKTAAAATMPEVTRNTKPLAVDEDPAMIGKRNLNGGLISKMSMSVEKEVALGRQLAAGRSEEHTSELQ